MIVQDAMNPNVLVLHREQTLEEAAYLMTRSEVTLAAVVDIGFTVPAVLSDADLRRAAADGVDPRAARVAQYLSYQVREVSPRDDLAAAVVQARVAATDNLLVVDEGHVVGLVAPIDALRALLRAGGDATIRLLGRTAESASPV